VVSETRVDEKSTRVLVCETGRRNPIRGLPGPMSADQDFF
jgi:hypothetical protein